MVKKVKEASASNTYMTYVTMPNDMNNAGVVHGGVLLKLIDQAAGVCAARFSESSVVTACLDRVYFLEPINIGELVILKASINYVGNTSMEIGVRVETENVKTGKKRHTNSCYVTMVAVDDKGKPKTAPQLKCVSAKEIRGREEGEARVKNNLKALREYKKHEKQNI